MMGGEPGQNKSAKLEVQPREVRFGYFSFDTNVSIDSTGKVIFTEDLEAEDSSFMSENGLQELFDSGILQKGRFQSGNGHKSFYELASDGYSGSITLNKDELNNAIKSGKLKLTIQEDGAIVFAE